MVTDKNIIYDIETFAAKYPLYDGPRPVAAAKRADLTALAKHLPVHKRQQYYDLTTNEGVVDSGNELEDAASVLVEGDDDNESQAQLAIM
jgi:hypothetical protein